MSTTSDALVPIHFDRKKLSDSTLRLLYKKLIYPRLIEDKMLILIRQGKVSKWFSGVGQEAISVGCAAALRDNEFIFTMHRNLGVFTTRELPLDQLFLQWQGKAGGFTKGRDRSFHFGSKAHHIVGMISHLGPQLSLAAGVALAHKIRQEGRVSLAFTGDGATSQGEFHEALNLAAVWQLPVIFVIENNQYGLSTPTNEQYACKDLVDRAVGYGMNGVVIDGNNILDVYTTIAALAADMRENPRPVLVECKTFRVRGHEEASGTKYVPDTLQKTWAERDPINNYEQFLLENQLITEGEINELKKDFKKRINDAADFAFAQSTIEPSESVELGDVFKKFEISNLTFEDGKLQTAQHAQMPNTATLQTSDLKLQTNIRFVDAISEGLREAMLRHDNLVLMGQDIAEYGGVFKITDGFAAQFGKARVRNTPLCESAVIGAALGLSIGGMKAMVEMQFADFVSCGFNQIVNNLAKINYRWGENADVVIRMPTGGSMGAGPFHSQSNEAWFTHVAGLKIFYPSTPEDAKGLLLAAFDDPNPVLFFEHKALYRSLTGEVTEGYFTTDLKARVVKTSDIPPLSILTYGLGVQWAKTACAALAIEAEIIDLRVLVPLDYETIEKTVKKTGKVLILHEDNLFGGIGGEIAAWISEHLFEALDAPVMRVASLDMPIPFAQSLERIFLPEERLRRALEKLVNY
ncbi:MAG: dehydrogenase E1 component subunit alpha/beta [Saprospiraceae bacterium]|nr:dehydrogenase E1 component subunit alpha/beta [Saprospiraceae bacterium]